MLNGRAWERDLNPEPAVGACAQLELAAVRGGDSGDDREPEKQGMIAKAQCMRTHGVPNFPDPFFDPGGRGSGIHLPPGFNSRAPAVVRAAKTCASVGTAVPGAGVD